MDVYERLDEADLQQAAVILESLAYPTAHRDRNFHHADGMNDQIGRRK